MKSLPPTPKAPGFPATNIDTPVTSAGRGGRLIILVPADCMYGPAAKRIWQLAAATGRRVQLLGLCRDPMEELSLRRQLILMSALVGDLETATEAKVETGTSWVEAARRNYRTGDVIVCFAEHRYGILQEPVTQVLQADLDMPIYILSGWQTGNPSGSRWVFQAILWLGWLGILAGGFLLQSWIMRLSDGPAETTLLILTVILEFWLIWFWNDRLR